MSAFHDYYVGQFPRVRECLPLPIQYHNREWIHVVRTAVECKYLGAYHEQLDCLLHNNQYSRLEEVRRNRCVGTYHGRTGKMALAQDEWLKLNNKEFAMYPSVRTLDGMSCQGQFIDLTQKAKQVIEMIYSPGAISDCTVHRSGMGSNGNCTPEKKLIGEVIGLFLGNPFNKNNCGRVLE